MPRNLARLRYKPPTVPVRVAPRTLEQPQLQPLAQKKAGTYFVRGASPQQLNVQVVLNPRARLPTTGKIRPAIRQPLTLRDVVDPDRKAQHGQIIYIFRHVDTNQIIYSLQELLSQHHLEQLPFLGRKSKPPTFRPDHWTPHCVITFPTPAQGHNAFRKLREFRKLHELSWDKTNPEWRKIPVIKRMKNIMNQRANTTADLAEVLRLQIEHGVKMEADLKQQQEQADAWLAKRRPEMEALVRAAEAKEKLADNIDWLLVQIKNLKGRLQKYSGTQGPTQQRLKNALNIQQIRLRKILYAQRNNKQVKAIEAKLAQEATLANAGGANSDLDTLQRELEELRAKQEEADPLVTDGEAAQDTEKIAQLEAAISALESSFEAKSQLDSRSHYIYRSSLPKSLRIPLPTPYTIQGVAIKWVDIQDALYASGNWPEGFEHEILDLHARRKDVVYLSAEEFEEQKQEASVGILREWQERHARRSQASVEWEVDVL